MKLLLSASLLITLRKLNPLSSCQGETKEKKSQFQLKGNSLEQSVVSGVV